MLIVRNQPILPCNGGCVNADWQPEDLARHFSLFNAEHSLLANKSGATRLSFAVLLKSFQLEGRFPDTPDDVPTVVVEHLALQCGVSPRLFDSLEWDERSARTHRTQVRHHFGFNPFRTSDEAALVIWLADHLTDLDPNSESLKNAALSHLRSSHCEAPNLERLQRLMRDAVRKREARFLSDSTISLTLGTRTALDALIAKGTLGDEDELQPALFAARSDLATLKDDAGAVKVNTVLEELEKLRQLRALDLPANLFHNIPTKMVSRYRRRAASEAPSELRRHPNEVRWTLLAALCWQRQFEITDNLVELLIHIAHHIGTRAENRVEAELVRQLRKVAGKTRLLYKLAKAARAKPEGVMKDVIYPAVSEVILDDLIKESEVEGNFDKTVRLVTRNSYGYHYRRIVPLLLEALEFKCNNERHRPVMQALELLTDLTQT